MSTREIVLLGATGSIGTQAVDVVRENPDRFRVVGLGAGGGRVDLLAAQALELGVDVVAVARATAAQDLQLAFYAHAQARGYSAGEFSVPKILAGPDAMTELADWPCDSTGKNCAKANTPSRDCTAATTATSGAASARGQ